MKALIYLLKTHYLEHKQARAALALLDAEIALWELKGKPKEREARIAELHRFIKTGAEMTLRDLDMKLPE